MEKKYKKYLKIQFKEYKKFLKIIKKKSKFQVDRLLSLEVHIRLMDIPLLKKKPPVPEVPTDLSWIPTQ